MVFAKAFDDHFSFVVKGMSGVHFMGLRYTVVNGKTKKRLVDTALVFRDTKIRSLARTTINNRTPWGQAPGKDQ